MKAFTYIKQGEFGFTEKEKPTMIDAHDAIVYDKPQMLPLPDMYGKNLIFKTGGVDGCDCEEIKPQGWRHQGCDISWLN